MRRGVVNKFNRGEIDQRAMNRDDVDKINNSCDLMENFTPMRLGPMQFRSGSKYLGTLANASYLVPFVASTTDTALLSFESGSMTAWVNDVLVARTTSTLTLTNQTFDTDLTGWTGADGAGSTSAWATGGYLSLLGNVTTSAKRWQTFGGASFIGIEHGITIEVLEAPVVVKIGESGVDSNDIFEGTLEPGFHSFVIIPVASLPTVTLSNSTNYRALVSQVSIEVAGTMSLAIPHTVTTLSSLRYAQSADVLYVGDTSGAQFKVERRGTKSWAIVPYRVDDGPFGLINNTEITLAAAALNGNTTLTASAVLFSATSVGNLYKLTSAGQTVSASVTAQDTGTNSIRVTGVETTRQFTLSRTGTWVATVTLQRSTDDATWQDVETYTTNGSKTYNDELDNSILFYRLHVKTGEYTSGTVELDMVYTAGSIDGVARVTAFTSTTVVDVQVLEDFGSTDATRNWKEGEWGTDKGFPSAASLYEGRLWWGGKTKLWGSVSDEFQSLDTTIEGNSAAIRRTIGFGPVDRVEWLAPSSRLIMGLASDEIGVRSSSFGEVLTPTNINLKSGGTQGAAPIEPVKIDDSILFVQRSGIKIMESNYSIDSDSHTSNDLTMLNPRICKEGIKRIAVSRQPETRVYVVMDDGDMRVYLMDPVENVAAWSRVTVDGTIEDVAVLPGTSEDAVYITVSRTGGRYLERMSLIDNMITEHHDSAVLYTSPGTSITGLSHLNGKTVGVWADNQDRGTFTVAGGKISVNESWTTVTVGLPYVADYRSNKLGQYLKGHVQGRRKRVVDLHLAMLDYWPAAIKYGPTLAAADLDIMPLIGKEGETLDLTTLILDSEETPMEFNGSNDVDSRVCIRATNPCTILAISYGVVTDGDSGGDES